MSNNNKIMVKNLQFFNILWSAYLLIPVSYLESLLLMNESFTSHDSRKLIAILFQAQRSEEKLNNMH